MSEQERIDVYNEELEAYAKVRDEFMSAVSHLRTLRNIQAQKLETWINANDHGSVSSYEYIGKILYEPTQENTNEMDEEDESCEEPITILKYTLTYHNKNAKNFKSIKKRIPKKTLENRSEEFWILEKQD